MVFADLEVILNKSKLLPSLGLLSIFLLTGCLSSSDDTTTATTDPDPDPGTNTSVKLAGIVSAPGGTVAFNPPTGLNKFFAGMFGGNAVAALTGTSVVADATVDLIEIDVAGAQVGDKLATATTDSTGAYSLDLPEGFVAASKYVVRATGSGSETMDAVVVATDESIDVDPVSQATRALIVAALQAKTDSSLADLKLEEIKQMAAEVRNLEQNLDLSSASTVSAFVTAFKDEATNNEEVNNVINSTLEAGEICGNVTDSDGTALENVVLVARDYGNWVTRSKTKTDSSGDYCLNVPPSKDYILGALNYTNASTSGSEWWTCADTETTTCGTAVQLDAEKVSVADATITKDFVLEPGVRIEGTVTTEDTSAPLGRVVVMLRTYDANIATVAKKTKANGTYRINMRPGVYKLFARNSTRQKFATEAYNTELDGGLNFREAEKMDLSASSVLGTTITADFSLGKGFPIGGTLTEGGTAVAGARVHFFQNGTVNVRRTNKEGKFRLQLRPGNYAVLSHGQRVGVSIPRDLLNDTIPLTLDADVGKLKVKVMENCDANGANGTPVSQAKALLWRSTKISGVTSTKLFAVEPTNADGSSEMFIKTDALAGGKVRFMVRVDDGKFAGSIVHKDDGSGNNTYSTTFSGGSDLRALINDTDKTHDLGEVCLPDGGVVKGTVTNSADQPVVNALVRVFDCVDSACAAPTYMVTTRTNIEGKYKISLPAGMVAGLKVQTSRVKNAYSDMSTPTTIVADETATIDHVVAMTEPLGVYVDAGDSEAIIYWKPVPGATSYKVYMGTSTGVTVAETLIGSPTTTTYTHTGLTNDTAYYFVVTAVDASSNESDISEEVTVTPSVTATGS